MLASCIYKNLCRTGLRNFGASIAHMSSAFDGSNIARGEPKNVRILEKPIFPQRRRYSSETGVRLPPLTDFPIKLWPTFFKTIRNSFFVNMVIRPQWDQEFQIADFVTGSKQALVVIGSALACEDYEKLEGLVTDELLQTLRQKICSLTEQQRQLLVVDSEDIYMSFPYEVGIIQDGEGDRERTFVEITVVHHMLRGLAQMRQAGEEPPISMGMKPEYREKIFVANYRFIREYTKGVDSPWIVNMLNHFMPVALVT